MMNAVGHRDLAEGSHFYHVGTMVAANPGILQCQELDLLTARLL